MNDPYTVTVTRGGAYPAQPLAWTVTADSVDEALLRTRGAIVVDGNADDIIESLTAAGWGQADRVEYIGGKRIRYLTVPVADEETA